ncbi:U2 small nuclear ribonucleoprotein A, putative [Theileria equi strain WA]|uniref:U2 small nuclear ribonucleoprotein A, putative n=1 Tax=Theileria equi strain WA TaxID=1537102 RepID=L0AXZ6_THEEQ|nr:U2 small nuclear ribonucleoprotein A, putative [Theileria equi strain WA]AFZ80143.1 U2 small nuclear ribonucleoprotein A, putative [Theileria equi strain WA]|eukprot:XP_004829809.1 U2 small nuclear ribonucleoprotein A, putative [Theileria equi strain WA]
MDEYSHRLPLWINNSYSLLLKLNNSFAIPSNITLHLHLQILAGNRISKIDKDITESLPNLSSLVLTGNLIAKISDLEPLFRSKTLERLTLLDNHVTAVPHFREYIIYKIPTLRYLNFLKVKEKERLEAAQLFNSPDAAKVFAEMGYELDEEME